MPDKHSILIIEDDSEIRRLLESILTRNGFIVAGAESAEAALKRIQTFKPSLIILDFQLPGMDGLECCKRLRMNSATQAVPIILLSAHNSEVYKITALESGADDFVTKPFSHGELIARVRAVMRRYEKNSPGGKAEPVLKDKLISIDRETREVMLAGKLINLSPKEFSIMEFFLKMQGKVLSRDVLSAQVWEQENLQTSRTIDVHIARLRKKLGKHSKHIQTVGKLGYKYVAPTA